MLNIQKINHNRNISVLDLLNTSKPIHKGDYQLFTMDIDRVDKEGDIADVNDVFFYNYDYKKAVTINLLSTIKYIGDINIFTRTLGIRSIDFVDLMHSTSHKAYLKCSWEKLYHDMRHDVSLPVKVMSTQLISHLLKKYLDMIMDEGEHKGGYYIPYETVTLLCELNGWKTIIESEYSHNMISAIISSATIKVIGKSLPIIVCTDINRISEVSNMIALRLTDVFVTTVIPDIHLFNSNKCFRHYNVVETGVLQDNINVFRKFIAIQMNPYNISGRTVSYSKTIKIELTTILKILRLTGFKCNKLIDVTDKYTPDSWHQIVRESAANLFYQGNDNLSIYTVIKHKELYAFLTSITNPDDFLNFMANDRKGIFYSMIDDGIIPQDNFHTVKQEMFIAFASAHIADLLNRCGVVLTEDIFFAIFGVKPEQQHVCLLHRGILLRRVLINADNDAQQNTSLKNWHNIHYEIRIAQQTALQLICTYFIGLDKIIKITPSNSPRVIPAGFSQINYDADNVQQVIRVSNEVELIEYPVTLVGSFIDAISNSTPFLYQLQKKLCSVCSDSCLTSNIVFTQDTFNNLSNFMDDKNKMIIKYVTGYDEVEQFQSWISTIKKEVCDKDTIILSILNSSTREYSISFLIFIVLLVGRFKRDITILRYNTEKYMKEYLRQQLSPYIKLALFSSIYQAGQLVASFTECEHTDIAISNVVYHKLESMYSKILPHNDITVGYYIKSNLLEIEGAHNEIVKMHSEYINAQKHPYVLSLEGTTRLELKPWIVKRIKTMTDNMGLSVQVMSLIRGHTLCCDSVKQHDGVFINHSLNTSSKNIRLASKFLLYSCDYNMKKRDANTDIESNCAEILTNTLSVTPFSKECFTSSSGRKTHITDDSCPIKGKVAKK